MRKYNARQLSLIFLNFYYLSLNKVLRDTGSFSFHVSYRQGAPRKRGGSLPGVKGRARFRTEESFYENPYPECICSSKKH